MGVENLRQYQVPIIKEMISTSDKVITRMSNYKNRQLKIAVINNHHSADRPHLRGKQLNKHAGGHRSQLDCHDRKKACGCEKVTRYMS